LGQTNVNGNIKNKIQAQNVLILQSIKKKDTLSLARAHYKLGKIFDYSGKRDSAHYHFELALELANKIDNNKAIAIIGNSLASVYSIDGLHKKSISIYENVVYRFLQAKDTSHAADVLLNLASEYFDLGNYEKALQIDLKALQLKVESNDSTNIAAYYQKIGHVFEILKNKNKQKEYLFIAYKLSKNPKYADFYIRIGILNDLAGFFVAEKQEEKAKKIYTNILSESKKQHYLRGQSVALSNLIPILKKEKKLKLALAYCEKALKINEESKNIRGVIYNLIELSKLLIPFSEYKKAEHNLNRAVFLSKKYHFPEELLKCYKILTELHSKIQSFKKAFKYQKKYLELKDSVSNTLIKNKIYELETKFQTEKKEHQIDLLNNKNIIQQKEIKSKNRIIFLIGLLLLVIIFAIILFIRQTKLKTELSITNLQQKMLRAQMNPHFIFNALISIQGFVLSNKKLEASDYLSDFASLMRLILESSRKEFITLKQEIEIINYYTQLQLIRFNNGFTYSVEIDESINQEKLLIPPMILQPFIENAIEHGFKDSEIKNKRLLIIYKLELKNLVIIVENNGKELKKNIPNKNHKSYATEITKERLYAIKKQYQKEIKFTIADLSEDEKKSGVRVTLKIPEELTIRQEDD